VTVVLVPDELGRRVLGRDPRVRALPWDAAGAEAAAVLVVDEAPVDDALVVAARLPGLRLIQTLSAGTEHWTGRVPQGVTLSNARGAHGGATAEWAAAVLLAVVRRLPGAFGAQAEHRWSPEEAGTLMGRRVLIVGAGDLATELRARLLPFGARVTLVGRSAREGVHAMGELDALLPAHDVTVLMVPLTDATRGLVDAAFLARMPDGSLLVNAARGAVVDTGALLAELRARRLQAALDVTDPEPLPAGHPLWDAPGLLITPHVGGFVEGHAERAWAVAATQIGQFLDGREPDNAVRG
jgi:phosphoglycerate dehydrogenase-like enzyme